jgi:hypothetical protein
MSIVMLTVADGGTTLLGDTETAEIENARATSA